MAWTTTKAAEYPVGNYRAQLWTLVADSATLELSTGLKNLISVQKQAASAASANHKVALNVLSAGAASPGTLSITGAVSGETYYVTVVGS